MYARQIERGGRLRAAFGRIAEGRKVGRELGMNRPNQGRAAARRGGAVRPPSKQSRGRAFLSGGEEFAEMPGLFAVSCINPHKERERG